MVFKYFKGITIRGDLTFLLCLIVVILMPVYVYYLPPFMILWGIAWLFKNGFRVNRFMFSENKAAILFLLFIAFYLWQISGLLMAESIGSGFERISKRMSFLLFPLVLFYPGEKIIRNINVIVRLFAISTFIYILYCFGNALNHSLTNIDGKWIFNPHPLQYDYENYFFSDRFSNPIHPSYLSGYVLLSFVIVLESLFDKGISLLKKVIYTVMASIFLAVIYLLSSRAGFLATFMVTVLYFFIRFRKKQLKWIFYSFMGVLLFFIILIASTNDKIRYDISKITSDTLETSIEKDVRYTIWRSSLNVIKENPVTGVGTGDVSSELKKEFKSLGYSYGYYEDLNAHNQFIEILLENGIIGLVLFLILLGYMIYIAISQGNLIYGLFILMMIIFFFFETVLNRIAGVTFFPLFAFLLIYLKSPQKT